MSTLASPSPKSSPSSPSAESPSPMSKMSSCLVQKSSTRRVATIKVTKPQLEQSEPSRSLSFRTKGTSREPSTSSSSVQVLSVDEKDMMSNKNLWRTLAKSAKSKELLKSQSSPLPAQPTQPSPKPMMDSVGPSAFELSQRTKSDGKEQWKMLKTKLSSLRKKSASESETISDQCSTLSIPRAERSARGSTSSVSSNCSLRTPGRSTRSNSQDEGIVCKKEDLLHLLSEVSKQQLAKRNSAGSPTSSSPTPSISSSSNGPRTSLKNQPRPLAASLADREDNCPLSSSKRATVQKDCEPPKGQSSPLTEADSSTNSSRTPVIVVDAFPSDSAANLEQSAVNEDTEVPEANVQWDEGNTVDAMMLGDAIEAFLKNISEPSPAAPPVEKRVSFKKC
ncbi:hypothetical protein HDE_11655 [Halotydeus destructor]|nr:hypothetical protein HDE_11655 [Halotydeus destructor]